VDSAQCSRRGRRALKKERGRGRHLRLHSRQTPRVEPPAPDPGQLCAGWWDTGRLQQSRATCPNPGFSRGARGHCGQAAPGKLGLPFSAEHVWHDLRRGSPPATSILKIDFSTRATRSSCWHPFFRRVILSMSATTAAAVVVGPRPTTICLPRGGARIARRPLPRATRAIIINTPKQSFRPGLSGCSYCAKLEGHAGAPCPNPAPWSSATSPYKEPGV